MAGNIGSLFISFSADISSLQKDFKKVRKSVTGLQKGFKLASVALGAFLGGSKAISAISGTIRKFADYNDTLAKTARRLGVSAQFLEEFRYVAARAGVATGVTDKSIQRLNRRLGDVAVTGAGEAVTALKSLGDGLYEAALFGAGFEKLIPKIADRINELGATESASITQKLFGREGIDFLTVFEQGSKGIRELSERYRELNGVISEEALKSSEDFNDAMEDLHIVFQRMQREIFPDVLDFFTQVILRSVEAYGEIKTFWKELTQPAKFRAAGNIGFDQLLDSIKGANAGKLAADIKLTQGWMNQLTKELSDVDLKLHEIENRRKRIREGTPSFQDFGSLYKDLWNDTEALLLMDSTRLNSLIKEGLGALETGDKRLKELRSSDSGDGLPPSVSPETLEYITSLQGEGNEKRRESIELIDEEAEALTLHKEHMMNLGKQWHVEVDNIKESFQSLAKITVEDMQRAGKAVTRFIEGTQESFTRSVAVMIVTGQSFSDIFHRMMTSLLIDLLAELLLFTVKAIGFAIARMVTNVVASESKFGIIGALVGIAAVGGLVGLMLSSSKSQSKRAQGGVDSAEQGGYVAQTGLVHVHAGEVIGPLERVASMMGPQTSGDQTINVVLNDEIIARAAVAGMPRELNLRVGNF